LARTISGEVWERVLEVITPTQEEIERQSRTISQLTSALKLKAEQKGYDYAFIEPQGSTGRKQTQLRGAADIDLFVGLSSENYPFVRNPDQDERHKMLDDLMAQLVDQWFVPAVAEMAATDVQKTYSQHPYLSLRLHELEVDILACFQLSAEELRANGPITAVDRTVHHTNYVADRLTDDIRDTVRALKSFVRAAHAYGDRCAVGQMGITGVSLELLAILEGSFTNALDRLYTLDTKPVDYLQRPKAELLKNPGFKDDYIILTDPTDPARNIASSFTERAYRWVKHRIDELWRAVEGNQRRVTELLLEAPIPGSPLPAAISSHAISYEFAATGGTHYTILRDKLYSLVKRTEALMTRERTGEPRFGDILTEVYFEGSRYAIGFLVERPEIEPFYLRKGPPADLEAAVHDFKKAHPTAFEADGHLWIQVKRDWSVASEMANHLLRQADVRGLAPAEEQSTASRKVLNVLYDFVLQIEPELRQKITRVKETVGQHS
jgi:tRNA nucleotidyltransferase (CCA-adding enzyme)